MNKLKNKLRRNFSQIPNELIVDKILCHPSFRIAVYLFSKPDGWEVHNNDIMKRFNIATKDTMAKYWKTILKSGWVTRKRRRSPSGKLLGGYEYELQSEPINHSQDNHDLGDRSQDEPDPVNTDLGKNQTHSNKDLSNNTDIKQQQIPPNLDDLRKYVEENGFQKHINIAQFIAFYDKEKWMVGKGKNRKPMSSWKLAVCGWVERSKAWKSNNTKNGKPSGDKGNYKTTPGLLDD